MLKHTATTAAALALLIPATALGAQHHPFTLHQANKLAAQKAARLGWPNVVEPCQWHGLREATCTLIVDQVFTSTIYVARDGACPTPVVKRTSANSGVASGDAGGPNCHTGPVRAFY